METLFRGTKTTLQACRKIRIQIRQLETTCVGAVLGFETEICPSNVILRGFGIGRELG